MIRLAITFQCSTTLYIVVNQIVVGMWTPSHLVRHVQCNSTPIRREAVAGLVMVSKALLTLSDNASRTYMIPLVVFI